MTEKLTSVRDQLSEALKDRLTPEQLRFLVDEVLASPKKAWGDFVCKNPDCRKKQRQMVEIPDAKAVVPALKDLMTQAWGAPQEQQAEVEFKVVRNVYVVSDKDNVVADEREKADGLQAGS